MAHRVCGVCVCVFVCVQFGGILVQCVVYENYVRIVFKHYTPGTAPVLLVNHTRSTTINYWQTYSPLSLL